MKIENHNIDRSRNSSAWKSRSFESNPTPDTSGDLRTVLDTSVHQKKNPLFLACTGFYHLLSPSDGKIKDCLTPATANPTGTLSVFICVHLWLTFLSTEPH
jgi:hypothetical protein